MTASSVLSVALRSFPLLSAIVGEKAALEALASRVTWPNGRYRNDPVGFCIHVLGFAPTGKQIEILHAVRDHQRVAIPAGRKVGKSRLLAAIALWWYCAWDDATVVICAPSERQITEITWYDLVGLFHESGRCLECTVRYTNGPSPASTPPKSMESSPRVFARASALGKEELSGLPRGTPTTHAASRARTSSGSSMRPAA